MGVRNVGDLDNQVEQVVLRGRGSDAEVCAVLVTLIEGLPEEIAPVALAQSALLWSVRTRGQQDFDLEISLSEQERRTFKKESTSLLDEMLTRLVSAGLDEASFYSQLWNGVISSPLFSGIDGKPPAEKAFALEYVLDSPRVPYFPVAEPGLSMDEATRLHKSQGLAIEVAKVNFFVNRPNTSSTQDADQVLRVLEGLEDREDKVLILSHAIGATAAEFAKSALSTLMNSITT